MCLSKAWSLSRPRGTPCNSQGTHRVLPEVTTEHPVPPVNRTGQKNDSFVRLRATGDPDLREQIFRQHRALAWQLARRYSRRGEPDDDLLQVASIGLLKAIDRYSPDRGVAFTSYAVPCILGELRRYFRDYAWLVHVPRQLKDLKVRLTSVRTELTSTLGRQPTIDETAAALGVSPETVLDVLAVGNAGHPASYDPHMDDLDGSVVLTTHDDGYDQAENRATLDPLLATLAPLDRCVLELRFGSDLTQTEIAERLGISQMQVSRRLTRTIRTLHDLAHHDD